MNRKRTIPLFLVLFIVSVLILPTVAGAPTTSRTLPTSVNVNSEIIVSIAVSDYGSFGLVSETIPDGFNYIGSTLDITQEEVTGNTIRFALMGESGFDYTLISPSNEDSYTFIGIIKDDNENEFTIGGDTSILVEKTAEQVNDPEQTSTPETQLDSDSETIGENPDEPDEIETSVDDVSNESSKSVKTTPSTDSTEDIPESETTPFMSTFGMIVIGVIAILVHKRKH